MEGTEFLELEGALLCRSIEDITTEEEEVGIFRVFLDEWLQDMLISKLLFELPWELSKVTDDLTSIFHLEISLESERERHEDEDSELPDDIFRRSHSDLDS